jgi:hypothetical protein
MYGWMPVIAGARDVDAASDPEGSARPGVERRHEYAYVQGDGVACCWCQAHQPARSQGPGPALSGRGRSMPVLEDETSVAFLRVQQEFVGPGPHRGGRAWDSGSTSPTRTRA